MCFLTVYKKKKKKSEREKTTRLSAHRCCRLFYHHPSLLPCVLPLPSRRQSRVYSTSANANDPTPRPTGGKILAARGAVADGVSWTGRGEGKKGRKTFPVSLFNPRFSGSRITFVARFFILFSCFTSVRHPRRRRLISSLREHALSPEPRGVILFFSRRRRRPF